MRKYHKWVGLVLSIFIILFSVSGIIMNHRQLFSGCEVGRWWLPSDYHLKNWNGGILKGTALSADSTAVYAYGCAGVWETDSAFSHFEALNAGMVSGVDNRKISSIITTASGVTYCAGLYDVYRLSEQDRRWEQVALGNNERIADIAVHGDTVAVLTRSEIYYIIGEEATGPHMLQAPEGYEPKVTLLKTVWNLHSGALFGLPGRIVVDILGVVLIVLCVTGIFFFFLPYSIRRNSRKMKEAKEAALDTTRYKEKSRRLGKLLQWNVRWHYKLGASLIVLTVLLSVTGMSLRPPLMVPLVMKSTRPVPFSTFDTDNAFSDKMRAIRWDEQQGSWIISTTDGFYKFREPDSIPVLLRVSPAVSPMGVTVFERNPDHQDEWLVGSFSGLFRWNITDSTVLDYFTGEPYVKPTGIPFGSHAVSGFTLHTSTPTVIDYSTGAGTALPAMPDEMAGQPMSLWNFALELHVGRCYTPFLGPVSVLFVFLAGLLLTITLISGYVVYRRGHRK